MSRSLPLATMAAALSLAFTAACTTPALQPAPTIEQRLSERGLAVGDKVERIPDYRIDGWNRLGDQHVVLNGGVARRYLITLAQPCSDLGNGETIGFSTTASALTALDTLIVETPIGPRRCPIREIHVLDNSDAAASSTP
jgi:hypothetical protein